MTTLLGTTLNGRYRLEARIGSGGMSTVYRAFDETLERQVAIKLMHREIATDSDQLERFRREARAVAQLSHPHIVGVIDAGEDEGRPYIVFEYVEGETLKERIRRQGRLPIPEAVAYAIEIARALGAAHARHIVHRDVKPQNVLIDEEGSAKVTDFGIARTLDEEGLTADGRVLGTTDYVSPEQALGQPVTGQSDLYSLGVVLYEMLTGEVPFKGDNQVAVAMKHVREEIPDVQVKRPEVSAALAAVVDTRDRQAPAGPLRRRRRADRRPRGRAGDRGRAGRSGDRRGHERAAHAAVADGGGCRCGCATGRRRCCWSLVVLAAAVGLVVWLGDPGAPRHRQAAGEGAELVPVVGPRCRGPAVPDCAHGYNPLGSRPTSTPTRGLAIDNQLNTAWNTADLLRRHAQQGRASACTSTPGRGAPPGSLRIITPTPGFTATVYAATITSRR